MLVAAVDTATLTLSCALLELGPGGAAVVATRTDRPPPGGPGHSVRLPGALTELLEPLGRSVRDVEGWAVGLGPGSFTGLRIGLATWKGLAYANRRPIAGASSLAAMALEAARSAAEGALLVPLLDARKGEVYAGFYRVRGAELEPVMPEAAVSPEALLSRVGGAPGAVGFGEGFDAFRGRLEGALPELAAGPATPSAEEVGRLAAARLARYDELALFALEPHYVRPSEAEVKFPRGVPVGPPAGTGR
ncbi:MAG TPA: tRNA (adenosine(37)-N6)-threonylcarbamoyltransferase complex dimerization subunit type 1 TsaB [Anaeromyxobacteraceae bacterium]|nr:tRNA (adenosine(37)-N6)-threonylcarbamoyltransferase complex dimerization subunit type 1 TsaB [Anaeromyxobacteraceae bacterium]